MIELLARDCIWWKLVRYFAVVQTFFGVFGETPVCAKLAAGIQGILEVAQVEIYECGVTTLRACRNRYSQVFNIAGGTKDSVIVRIAA